MNRNRTVLVAVTALAVSLQLRAQAVQRNMIITGLAVLRRVGLMLWIRRRAAGAVALAVVLVLAAPHSAYGQTVDVIYNFVGASTNGGYPFAGVIRDSSGNLYGTTPAGTSAGGSGTVYKVDANGNETVLHEFTGQPDGSSPMGALVSDPAGNLYGTTAYGGAHNLGTIFKIDVYNRETVLYSFSGQPDGANPVAGLIRDSAGNLYGTTLLGGAYGLGAVFKINASDDETVLYSFNAYANGANPHAGLVRDSSGYLYGTTYAGGTNGYGTVFRINASNQQTVLHSFAGPDGSGPLADLIRDSLGNLYGTTLQGGAHNLGTIFKVTPTGTETVLHSFGGPPDGTNPRAGLVRDAAGNLYGTTGLGGSGECQSRFYPYPVLGCGTIFKLTPANTETVLYSFSKAGSSNTLGAESRGDLVQDSSGNLYGTTAYWGEYGAGAVFKLVF